MKLYAAILTVFLFSCDGSSILPEKKKECEERQEGTLRVINTSKNPYTIYIDDVVEGRVEGGSSKTFTLTKRYFVTTKAKQISGYMFFPTEVVGSAIIKTCEESEWQIP